MFYPGTSTNITAVIVLALCAGLVVYGLWKGYRLFVISRSNKFDDVDIQGLYDVFKQDLLKGESGADTPESDDILTDFYKDVQPNDQRYLH